MKVSDFDFDLPEDRIALRPVTPREAARLLRVDGEVREDWRVGDLPSLLKAGDLLVINNTRVLPTQLKGSRERDGQSVAFEATLIKSLDGQSWQAFLKPGRRIREGDTLRFDDLSARVLSKDEDGVYVLRFEQAASEVLNGLLRLGGMPLPPYIRSKRPEDEQDKSDYQNHQVFHRIIFQAVGTNIAAASILAKACCDEHMTKPNIKSHMAYQCLSTPTGCT
jgi:S-adenosylmethionine:tRNA ribosyltransferase-isomerase